MDTIFVFLDSFGFRRNVKIYNPFEKFKKHFNLLTDDEFRNLRYEFIGKSRYNEKIYELYIGEEMLVYPIKKNISVRLYTDMFEYKGFQIWDVPIDRDVNITMSYLYEKIYEIYGIVINVEKFSIHDNLLHLETYKQSDQVKSARKT
jgi:hypothetical protein